MKCMTEEDEEKQEEMKERSERSRRVKGSHGGWPRASFFSRPVLSSFHFGKSPQLYKMNNVRWTSPSAT